jgi:hypothetical protein
MKRLSLSLRSGLLAVLASGLAMANTVTFVGSGSQSGQPVNAKAEITTSLNTVTVDLSNLLTAAEMVTVAQNLSDLSFTLSGTFASGLVSDANRTYSGKLIDVAPSGAVSTNGGDGIPASYNGWDFSNSGSTFLLEDLGSIAGPSQTIIGGTAGSSTAYSNAGGSIAGNGPHNPFLQGAAHFVLTIAGVTASTNITAATFSFGTTLGNNIPGTLQPVPEPRLVSFLLIGALLSAAAYYRKKPSVQ